MNYKYFPNALYPVAYLSLIFVYFIEGSFFVKALALQVNASIDNFFFLSCVQIFFFCRVVTFQKTTRIFMYISCKIGAILD